jgi:hypothetical protein
MNLYLLSCNGLVTACPMELTADLNFVALAKASAFAPSLGRRAPLGRRIAVPEPPVPFELVLVKVCPDTACDDPCFSPPPTALISEYSASSSLSKVLVLLLVLYPLLLVVAESSLITLNSAAAGDLGAGIDPNEGDGLLGTG